MAFAAFSIVEIKKLNKVASTLYTHPLSVSNRALQAGVEVLRMHRTMKELTRSVLTSSNEITEMDEHFNPVVDRLQHQAWIRDGLNRFNEVLSGNLAVGELAQRGGQLFRPVHGGL